MNTIKAGSIFNQKTNVGLLNDVFGTNYKQWMKCTYMYGDYQVWMISLDGKVKLDWSNTINQEKTVIIEKLVSTDFTIEKHKIFDPTIKRIVFDKRKGEGFEFMGVFEIDLSKSDRNNHWQKRVWNRISDKFPL